MSDSSLSSTDTLVASVTGEITRVIDGLVRELGSLHARERDEAVALLRREAEDALRQVREEAESARQRSVEEAVTIAEQRFAESERARLDSSVEQARADAATLRAELEAAAAASVRAAEDAAAQREAALHEQWAAEQRTAAEATAADLLASRAGEREQRLAAMERLLRAIVHLDAAASLRAALDALAEGTAAEAPRSAVFVVRSEDLRLWRASGVAAGADAPPVSCRLAEAGPLREAAATCQPLSIEAGALAPAAVPALAALQLDGHHAGLLAPVVVDGRTVALVYADDGEVEEREVPASWPEAVQILARHTARCLESITARRAVAGHGAPADAPGPVAHAPAEVLPVAGDAESARRFARLVVSELRLYHEGAVEAGRLAGDLRERLAGPINRARQQYEARVSAALPGRDQYFEQELLRTLAEGDPGMLGRGNDGA